MSLTSEVQPELLAGSPRGGYLGDAASRENKALPVHRWVPWIAGFSGEFVRTSIEGYLPQQSREKALVLDPFAGVGTTLVEALKAGIDTLGYEINPFAALVADVKIHAVDLSPGLLAEKINTFCRSLLEFEDYTDKLWLQGGDDAVAPVLEKLRTGSPQQFKSRIPFFSPPVEAKILYSLEQAHALPEVERRVFLTAIGAQMVSVSNYTYEPSLSSRPGAGKPILPNASVYSVLRSKLDEMVADVTWVRSEYGAVWPKRQRLVHRGSYFDADLGPGTVSLVITSPPYMNNYHYPRSTRPHLHWLGLVGQVQELQRYERGSFGKFWQTVRQEKEIGLNFEFPELGLMLGALRERSIERGAYGGPGWANYVATYFNDTARFLDNLSHQLELGGYAIIVIGNSIIQGMEFKVDQFLAQMAERRGLCVEAIRMMRTKRVGNSIVNSSVRNGAQVNQVSTRLYDVAVVLQRPN